MWKVTVRGLLAHKLRLVLTALAIVLGVGFVTGTYVLTDTINHTFDDLFRQTTRGIDVAVHTKAVFTGQSGDQRAPMPTALRDQIARIDGVKAADGSVTGYAQFVRKNGRPVTTGGAPTLGVSLSTMPELRATGTIRQGRLPVGPGEVVVDAHTARVQGFTVGDQVKILLPGRPAWFRVSGVIGFGTADNLAGATLAGFDLPTAQKILGRTGVYDEIDVVAARGVSQTTLRDRIRAAIDPRYEALTGKQLAQQYTKAVGAFTKFINYALLAFAFVALFVGSFIIVNTFSIILAQRTRELALLRCLGASRRQLMLSVLGEASITGLVASLAGIAAGVVIALGLEQAFRVIGADMPLTTLQLRPRTIVLGLLVGVLVTVVAAIAPALKAVRIPPVAALRDGNTGTSAETGLRRTVIGALVTIAGIALLLAGLFGDRGNRLLNVAVGTVVIFLGVSVLSPLIARPLARLVGWPFAHWAGEPGRLARQNAMRSPRRTASTAAALMIGLALVGLVSIFAASAKTSTSKILDQSVTADYILTGPSNTAQGFSPDVVKDLARQPQIESATGLRAGVFKLNGTANALTGIDPAAFARTIRTEVSSGRFSDLSSGGVAVREDAAKAHGWRVGDTVPMQFPVGGTRAEQIKAIFVDNHLGTAAYLLPLAGYERHFTDQLDVVALVKAHPGVAPAASRAAVDRVTSAFPSVQVRDQAEYKQQQTDQINQILVLFNVLLALAVVIAFIGIINTLVLSIFERIRELGLLRALGMTRRQIRAMVRWEAVIIAVFGAVLGLTAGVFFGWTLVRALHDQGITDFTLPIGTLLAMMATAAFVGVLAAVLPGRRAARIDILRAITTE